MPGAERATTIMRPKAMKIRDAIATTHLIHEQRLDHIESEGKSPAVASMRSVPSVQSRNIIFTYTCRKHRRQSIGKGSFLRRRRRPFC